MESKTVKRLAISDKKPQVMGSKTVKRLAILIVVVALITAGGYFARKLQVGRMAQGIVARAGRAEQEGNFARAAELYREHLAVVPDDSEVLFKYAEAILKLDRSPKRLQEAMEIFEGIVRQSPGREDARRRAAEVAFDIGGTRHLERARVYLVGLLKTAKNDGHLEYLMARCEEQDNEFALAADYYKSAIEHGAPERLEASQRRARLLRDKLGEPAEVADRVIDEMVKSAPDDYRVYLERGRYRNRPGAADAEDDFRKALKLAPDRPDVYLEVARLEVAGATAGKSGLDAARQVLDKGLEAAPKAVELYIALSNLEQMAGSVDRAVAALELGLKHMPDQLELRGQLALLQANQGETGRLLLQVAELERIGAIRQFTQYLRAYYYFNRHEFVKARQVLLPLQPDVAAIPGLKSRVNMLLGRCYAELNEPELQVEATLRAFSTDPKDPAARLGWIQVLISRGDLDEAIREYRGLKDQQPGIVRLRLAALLIERNRRLPAAQRQWREIEQLIDEATAASPGSPEPVLLRAGLLLDQGQEAKALDTLATARGRFPTHPGPWITEAEIRMGQKKYDEAQGVLERAQQRLGDRVDLRLARARLVVGGGGPQVVPALNELAGGIEGFSREDRRRLLTALALELGRQQDLAGAARAWTRLVELEPESLEPRLQLFELALQSQDRPQAKGQIEAVAKLDEQFAQFCRARYMAWQARGTADASDKAKLRGDARVLLTDLKSRRPDWARVPLALAGLDEQELEQGGLDEAQAREKLESAIIAYRRAMELGVRDPGIVRHVVQLLFRAGRGSEALEVYGRIPSLVQHGSDVGRMALEVARAKHDYRQVEEFARKAVAANPEEFQARLWLAQVLLEDRRPADAEVVLREAVAAAKADSDRWVTLVLFLIQSRRGEEAEQAVRDAEANLAQKPLALAQCCQLLGNAYAAADASRTKAWFDRARHWFGKARDELKDPDDPTFKRRFVTFLLQTNQAAEAEGALKEILARAAGGKSPDLAAWARRSLAQVYAVASPPRTDEALALFAGKEGDAVADADDLRVLAMIHEAQGTPRGRSQAIGDLKALIGRESAGPEDRLRLAQLLEAAGEWPQAREQFRELILRTDGARDAATLGRRPRYLLLFLDTLIRHHQPGDDSDLVDARQLVEKFQVIQKDEVAAAILEARIDKAANQLDAANARLRDFAGRPNLPMATRLRLAAAAEQLGLLGAAESILRRVASEPPADPNQFHLALFLGRQGRIKDVIDLCEPLWADAAIRVRVAGLCVQVLCDTHLPLDAVQVNRVLGWIERARIEDPRSTVYVLAQANLNERLGDYPKAEEMYRAAIKMNDSDGHASNNLAWLMALNGGKRDEALALINDAIRLKGEMPEFLDTRGMIYVAAGEGQRAIADLEKALRAAPNGSKCFHLAQAYLLVGQAHDKEKARKFLEAGKTQGLPSGLHRLEMATYKKVTNELGMP